MKRILPPLQQQASWISFPEQYEYTDESHNGQPPRAIEGGGIPIAPGTAGPPTPGPIGANGAPNGAKLFIRFPKNDSPASVTFEMGSAIEENHKDKILVK